MLKDNEQLSMSFFLVVPYCSVSYAMGIAMGIGVEGQENSLLLS